MYACICEQISIWRMTLCAYAKMYTSRLPLSSRPVWPQIASKHRPMVLLRKNWVAQTHTCAHTYRHAHTCKHAYSHTYMHIHMLTYMDTHTCLHPYMRAYIHKWTHTYTHIYRYMHTHNIQICIFAYMQTYKQADIAQRVIYCMNAMYI